MTDLSRSDAPGAQAQSEPVHAFVDLTAEQWQLYADEPGATAAAQSLNHAFNTGVRDAFIAMSQGRAPHEAIHEFEDHLLQARGALRAVGACDSEVNQVCSRQLDVIFGETLRAPRPTSSSFRP